MKYCHHEHCKVNLYSVQQGLKTGNWTNPSHVTFLAVGVEASSYLLCRPVQTMYFLELCKGLFGKKKISHSANVYLPN